MMRGSRQGGAALLMVLVALAMLAGGLTWMVQQGRQQVDAVRLQQQRVQARAMELAGLAFAKQALQDPTWRQSPLFWQALRGQPLQYSFAGGSATLRIRDLHSCFNVNALAGPEAERAERQLQYLLGDDLAAERLLHTLADWVDSDSQSRLHGAENDSYLRQSPPRLAADQQLVDISELDLLLPAEPGRHRRYPQLCALPQTFGWRLNANALGVEHLPLLEAMYEGEFPRSLLSRIITGRPANGYRDVAALRQAMGAMDEQAFERLTEGLLLNSGDFMLQLEFEQDAQMIRSQFQVQAQGVVRWHAQVPVQRVQVVSREPMPL